MITFNQEDVTERRAIIVAALKDKICAIKFTKVDGTVRVMPCTLDTKLMPPVAVNEHHKTKAFNPAVLSVWCTDAGGWRSFRLENVLQIGPLGDVFIEDF